MSEENKTPETPETKESVAASLLATIAEKVKNSAPEVTRRYAESQAEKEISARVDLLDRGMQKRFSCLYELNKVNRPDVVTYDVDGKETGTGTYTKERVKAIKDSKEALAKIENALEKALGGDWSKLKEICK